ncbi:PHP domain-containing protein [Candidatus Woesearchaeota archaeon]|nr:PHP domain-containing protein [Candidatus Woesearchaeota archaeon]
MRYDLHVHTHYSACSVLKPKIILKLAKKAGLGGIAVADHNTVRGGLEVKKANKDRDFEVIPSIEVSTDRGHVLGLYVSKEIKSRDFFAVSDKIRKQGGIVILAHPFRLFPHLRAKVKGINLKRYLDAVECNNARTSSFSNKSAIKLADRFSLAKTGGSDSHFSFEIGRSVTVFDGSLRDAIRKRKTRAEGGSVIGLVGSTLSFFKKHVF